MSWNWNQYLSSRDSRKMLVGFSDVGLKRVWKSGVFFRDYSVWCNTSTPSTLCSQRKWPSLLILTSKSELFKSTTESSLSNE